MTTTILALLAVFGGVAWAFSPAWYLAWACMLPLPALAGRWPGWHAYAPVLPIAAALGIGVLFNPGGQYAHLVVIWAWCLLWPLLQKRPEDYQHAAMLWFALAPVAEQLTGLNLSSNVQATWGYLFALAALGAGRPWLALLCAMVPVAVLSRGGMMALAAGLLVWYWPAIPAWVRARWAWGVPIGLAIVAGLWTLRPATAGVRLYYYAQAMHAWAQNWLFGVGPGQLSAAHLITDPRNGDQVHHAHNLYLDVGAEWGLVGLGLFALAAWITLRQPQPRWVLATLAALAVHGLVDNPIWLPGVAIYVVGLIVSSQPR